VSELLSSLGARYMQLALVEVLLLAGLSALLGPWIVLRRRAFFAHAAATVTFPGLVLAAALALPAAPLAAGCAVAYALLVARSEHRDDEAVTGLLLVGALAVGAVLASDIARSGAGVDRLLFGTLVALSPADVALSAATLALAGFAQAARGRSWLLRGFDPAASGSLGAGSRRHDGVLLVVIALAVVAALAAVGSLLASVLLVVPAATARLLRDDLGGLRRLTGMLAAGEGIAALAIAQRLDVAVGPVLAVLAGAVFALVAAATAPRAMRVRPA
jgi:ABC-type Mn2+/Zn2+ transport system permease subunit